jgi:isopenicillin N synthase-like dioxygenase
MAGGTGIPVLEVGALFGGATPARAAVDRAVMEAAGAVGFAGITGLPPEVPVDRATRLELLRIISLAPSDIRRLWRQKFDGSHPNVYRGWFPAQAGDPTHKEGIDLGPDVAYGSGVVDPDDVLREATPLPPEASLPGWRAAASTYYRALERTATVLMRSIARGLGLEEHYFDSAFAGGISTLRLIRYPVRGPESLETQDGQPLWVSHGGQRRYLVGRPHVDSGFLTLLAQDGVEGLQARAGDGVWLDVPPREATLVMNFGRVLERWTGGRIQATEHRVLAAGRERYSIPYFHEPRVDALIAPLPIANSEPFEPFLFGDHLWSSITRFVEFHGMEGLRRPRGAGQAGALPAADSRAFGRTS